MVGCLYILLAAERSGTHLFRSIIARNKAAFAPGEVANAAASGESEAETNFFSFRRQFLLDYPAGFIPSRENTERLVDAFFEKFVALAASRGRPTAVCDIKYGHVVNFCGGWWDMMSAPFLMEWAQKHRVKLIHLVRRRTGETCVSNLYAHHTGVWRTKNPSDLQISPFHVQPERLNASVAHLERVIRQFRDWLRRCDHIEIHYEDLLSTDSPSWRNTRRFLEHPIPEIKSDFLKTTPDYDQIIRNYDVLKPLLEHEIEFAAA